MLGKLSEKLDANAEEIVNAFYEHLLKVKGYQRAYFKRLTKGSYDKAYFENRRYICRAHDRIGLLLRWYLSAYRKYLNLLILRICHEHCLEDNEGHDYLQSLTKVIFLDMIPAIETYMAGGRKSSGRLSKSLRALSSQMSATSCGHP